ncbi:hypothetical protein CDD83_3273 [Cordyceps sp. RAO-2017]|nr:hypothetical protein CDD83_3273 [Cordyceps sp. RAO-2017]
MPAAHVRPLPTCFVHIAGSNSVGISATNTSKRLSPLLARSFFAIRVPARETDSESLAATLLPGGAGQFRPPHALSLSDPSLACLTLIIVPLIEGLLWRQQVVSSTGRLGIRPGSLESQICSTSLSSRRRLATRQSLNTSRSDDGSTGAAAPTRDGTVGIGIWTSRRAPPSPSSPPALGSSCQSHLRTQLELEGTGRCTSSVFVVHEVRPQSSLQV